MRKSCIFARKCNEMNKITNFIIHPAFLAFIITLLFIWILPPIFNKYEVELLEKQYFTSDFPGRFFYYDFDHDGNSEKVWQGLHSATLKPNFTIYSNDEIILDQWNFEGTWINYSIMFFGDYDNNGLDEVYGFTWENDSVFINGIEPFGDSRLNFKNKFLFLCKLDNKQNPCNILSGKLTDLDGDSYKEVVFSVNTGFNLQPRAIFAYDVKKDSVYRSPFMGASNKKIKFTNLDNDSFDEIMVDISANRNYATPVPYSDSITWLIALDNDLNFLFDPVPLNSEFIVSTNLDIKNDKEVFIVNIQKLGGKTNTDFVVSLYNSKGNIVSKSKQPEFIEGNIFGKKQNTLTEKLYITRGGDIYEFNSKFRFKKIRDLKINIEGVPYQIDLENDSIPEFIFDVKNRPQVVIVRNDFSHPVVLDAYVNSLQPFSVKHSKNKPDWISINAGKEYYLFEYKENPYYYFKYPIYTGIYFILFVFFKITFHYQKKRIQKVYETEKRLNELQMLTIRNQMNPHFTFNAINSISSVIFKEDKRTAYNFFTKFSDLIRFTLKNAEKISVPLSEEIEFVKNYLELEKFRFKQKFDYLIDVDKEVEANIQVPRMIVQTFAENAVKHGLSHLEKEGLLKIQISQKDHKLNLIVEDNGIGREAAGKLDILGTGKGMKIIDQIFDLYHKLKGKKITHTITDLNDDNNKPIGTRITVELEI